MDHSISLKEAVEQTARYRQAVMAEEPKLGLLAGYFEKAALLRILDQEGCTGLRIYNAKSSPETETFIVVGVTDERDDLLHTFYSSEQPHLGLAGYPITCPGVSCPVDSPLLEDKPRYS